MKRILALIMLGAVLAAPLSPRTADAFYQWVDEKGEVHITDYPPPGKAAPEQATSPLPAERPAAPSPAKEGSPVTRPTTSPHALQEVMPAISSSQPTGTLPPATAPAVTTAPASTPQHAPSPRRNEPARQEPSPDAVMAFLAAFLVVIIAVAAVLYLYFSFCLYRIAQKTNFEAAWAAWVPIIQLWPFVGAAGKPIWWVLLLFVPLVGFIVTVYLWMRICENLGKSKWLGLLVLVPVANIILPGYLALSRSE